MLAAHTHPNTVSATTSIGVAPNNGTYRQVFASVTRTGGDAINGMAVGTNFSDGPASSITRANLAASTSIGISNAPTGGTETRPVNLSLLACIKF
jgi:hypothetical protein